MRIRERIRFKNIDKFEVVCSEECDFGRSGMKVVVNDGEFMIGIRFEIEKFLCEVM